MNMSTTVLIINIAVLIFLLLNLYSELRRDLMMFQQNSYRAERYTNWLSQSHESTSVWRLGGIIVFMLPLTNFFPEFAGTVIMGIFGLLHWISLCRKKYKKPLAMTARATRIFITSMAVAFLTIAAAVLIWGHSPESCLFVGAEALAGAYLLSHCILMFANWLLTPIEKHITDGYINDAKMRLAAMPDLKIIGITGSYGKTSTKHYLFEILSQQYETLMTPGSFNTPMGVVRTIREHLKPYHEVFIVEMGAKARGDIDEICRIVHPGKGIITAVGPQHLESFKTIENVQATKFELADSLPADGLVIVNNDFEAIADRPVTNVACVRYAVKNTKGADYVARNIEYTPMGSNFTAAAPAEGWELKLRTPLVGECNISNILAAVAMARAMGVDDARIAYAVENLRQVEHRLAITRVPGGLTIIDDAFNSNPVGSAMALDVLRAMKAGKRFLITPGMIELGDRQYELNMEFGKKAAASADVVIVVGEYNREAIVEGLEKGGMDSDAIVTAPTFTWAQQYLQAHSGAGDIVLYENDLPDTFK